MPGRVVTASFDADGILGTITMSQAASGAPTLVSLDLAGLGQRVNEYHVHANTVFPGPSADRLGCAVVGDHFNPLNVTKGGCNPGDMANTCEIGDLSGKHGRLEGFVRLLRPISPPPNLVPGR